jgi:hypothetical protein
MCTAYSGTDGLALAFNQEWRYGHLLQGVGISSELLASLHI